MSDSADSSRIVKIHVMGGAPSIWNADDVHYLQTTHRIIGGLGGPLPRNPNQASQFGLPFMLMKEEAFLLIEKGFASPVSYPCMTEEPDTQTVNAFENLREQSFKEQFQAAFEERKKEIVEKSDKILKGKLSKLQKQSSGNDPIKPITKEEVIESECKKIKPLPENKLVVQTFIEHPFIKSLDYTLLKDLIPETSLDKLKYYIFKDLWEKNYYLTNGLKFGGDFLAYPSDPIICHASLVVKCSYFHKEINSCDLITCLRICNTTKKTFVIASLDDDNLVHYQSFNWEGDKL